MTMTLGEKPTPQRSHGFPGSAECAAAQEEIARFLSTDQRLADRPRLRQHLEHCIDCNQHYRESLLLAARMGRDLRRVREGREDDEAFETRAALGIGTRSVLGFPRPARKPTSRGTRIFWIAGAGLAVLAYLFPTRGVDGGLSLAALAGVTTAGSRSVEPKDGPLSLVRGERCSTGAAARARLQIAGTELDLAEDTSVLIEDAGSLRVRLERGVVSARGPCVIVSAFGIAEVLSGQTSISARADRALVECHTGRVRASDAQGTFELSPGRRGELTSPARH